jgi:DNA-binding NtrC family response regulator
MLLSFVRNPQRLKLAIEMLATVPRCTVSHEEEPQLSGNIGSAVLPSAVVILADHTRLDECCNVIRRLRDVWPTTPQLVLTDDVDADGLLRLLECGAFDFADLRASSAWTVLRIQRVLGMLPSRSATDDKGRDALRVNPATCGGLIGDAPEFVKLLKRLPVIARTNANVLLLGETGTGKEVCAHAIHYSSPRAQGPWVAINCAAIPAGLLESELFGHVRGAFTEAHTARVGLVPEASGGTLFLDEIDSLPLAAQAKLLRFLQDGEYRVLGSSTARHVDVRIIAASNCDLGFAAVKGHFRQDLYYRLNVLSMTMPPLRARREDIPALASYFLEQACRDAGKRVTGISSAAMHRLMTHEWPGNVRELKHAIERAVLLAEETLLHVGDIELDGTAQAAEAPLSFRDAKARAVEAFERRYLEQLLLQAGGNISHAARAAHKNRRALFELLRRHAIDASRFRMS